MDVKPNCYKVVYYSFAGQLRSAIADGSLELVYNVNEVTVPTIGGIFVFVDLSDARRFQNAQNEVWAGFATGLRPWYDPIVRWGDLDMSSVMAYWQNKSSLGFPRLTEPPYGTYLADSLMLIQRVE